MIRYVTPKFLLLSFFLLCGFAAFAHTGSVKGKITDANTKKPIDGANIFIKALNQSAVTDVFGNFFIKGLADGKYDITITHIGYETYTEEIKIEDGVTTDFNITLHSSDVTLTAVTINSQKNLTYNSISSIDMKLRPINTAQDMLRLVPGIFISQHQGGGKAEQLFLRGFDADHGTDVNISVDGMPVNMVSHAHGQGYADLHWLLPEVVDKMNFGKGPYEIDKGNLTTAGWVEFKTKDYLDNSFVKMEAGTYGYFRTVAGINLINDQQNGSNKDAYIAGEYAYNRSYFDQPQNFNRFNLIGKYTQRFSNNKQISITATGFRSTWDASGQIPERAVADGLTDRFGEITPGEGGNTSRYNLNIQYTQAINNHSFFKSNIYAGYYDFELYSDFTFFLKDSVNGDQIRQKEKRFFTGYNADYTTKYNIGRFKTKSEFGVGYRFDTSPDHELSHTLNRDITLERLSYGDIYETNIFGYFNQSLYITPQLVLNAGTRYDYFIHTYNDKLQTEAQRNTVNLGTLSPKAGIYYNFSDNARVFFNYGTGFHSNDTRVVVEQAGKDILPKAFSFDLGTVLKPIPKLLLSAALWRLDLQQEFVYVGDDAIVEPSGPTRRMGVDLSARYAVLKWLYFDLDMNYAHGRFTDSAKGNNYIPLAPVFTSIGGLSVQFKNGISGSLRYRYMGDRPANEDNSVTAKGYTVFDATMNYSRKHYELGFQIQNLFNTEWNEAQFDTESRLRGELASVSEIHFTPGTPFFFKLIAAYKF